MAVWGTGADAHLLRTTTSVGAYTIFPALPIGDEIEVVTPCRSNPTCTCASSSFAKTLPVRRCPLKTGGSMPPAPDRMEAISACTRQLAAFSH